MITVKEFETWPDFEEFIKRRHWSDPENDPRIVSVGPSHIFRGQPDASWGLETSLERFMGQNQNMFDYFRMIEKIRPEIETFIDRTWELPNQDEYLSWLNNPDSSMHGIPCFEYMAYLRHHGFPSPLLDWTYSPYIASYFAFREISSKAETVAIFEYYWDPAQFPQLSDTPKIFRLGNDIRTHKRHYLQQSVYTICCNRANGSAHYANHQDLYSQSESPHSVTKYILPASEREKVLWSLEPYNINAYSLLGTEESLLETLYIRVSLLDVLRRKTFPNWDHD